MFYIYDTDGNLINFHEGNYLDYYYLVGTIANRGLDSAFTVGKVTDEDGNEASEEALVSSRRNDRTSEFALTIDRVNGWWRDSLTPEQITEVGNWRQVWLDYPNDLTIVRPTRPTIF